MLTRVLLIAVATGSLLLASTAALSQEKKQPPAPKAEGKPTTKPAAGATTKPAAGSEAEMTPEMKAAMEAMQPGPAHAKLAKLAGEWTCKSKVTGAGAWSEESEGSSKIAVVLDGRFVHQEDTGTMMGMPYTSAKLMGYNNGSKKYEGVWTYTLGTGMMILNGTSDDEGKTIKCNATGDNEVGVKESMQITYKMLDDDHFTVILDGGKMPDGTPGPVMETNYTRKK